MNTIKNFIRFVNEDYNSKFSTDSTELQKMLNEKYAGKIFADRPYDPLYETIDISIKEIDVVNDLLNFIQNNNWYVSKNSIETSKYFEIKPIYSKGRINKIPDKLYHATPIENINSIKKEGLIPKAQDIRHKYPPRIYVTDRIGIAETLAKELKRWKNNETYTIFEIDTNRLTFDLYKDMTSAYIGNFYIQDIDRIPPSHLKQLDITI
jgi:hypothetical protein